MNHTEPSKGSHDFGKSTECPKCGKKEKDYDIDGKPRKGEKPVVLEFED